MASSIVGFSPATNPVATTGATAAPETAGDGANLFAMLLALVGAAAEPHAPEASPQATPQATTASVALPAATTPALLPETGIAATPPDSPAPPTEPVPAKAAATPSGKTLLKDLGDALVALSDAVEAGKPVDPALERKLNDAIDAVATYLGAVVPPPSRDRQFAALVSTTNVLSPKSGAELPAPKRSPDTKDPSDTGLPVLQDAAEVTPAAEPPAPVTSTSTLVSAPETARPADPAAPNTSPTPAQPAAAPTTDTGETAPVVSSADTAPAPAPTATAAKDAPPAQQALGLGIGRLSQRLEPQNPALAAKLDALAETLKAGGGPAALSAALGLDDSAAEPELIRIAEAIATPKPAPVAASAPQPFVAAQLALPAAMLASRPATPPPAEDQPEQPRTQQPAAVAPAPLPETSEQSAKSAVSAPSAAVEPQAAPTTDAKPEAKSSTPPPAPASSPPAPTGTPVPPPVALPLEAPVPIARAAHAAYQAPLHQVNLPQVAFQIARQFEAGNSRFQIRLDPAELGRIDVSLEVEKSGTINARMVVERPETLDLMQRDQRALQQALQQAGLDANKTNLEFSLRQNPFAQQGGMADGQGGGQSRSGGQPGAYLGDDTPQDASVTLYRGTATAGGVNLFV